MALKKLKISESPVPVVGTLDIELGSDESLPVNVVDNDNHPTLMDIPDEVDTTDGTIIYFGYIRDSSYLIARRLINEPYISTTWATGDWSDRAILFPSV